MTLLDASLVPSDDNTSSEEARRQTIRARELLAFARHIQRHRQRLKEHHDHLAWINRQVTQKIARQRVEQAQWEADHGRRQNGLAAPSSPEIAVPSARLQELESALAEEREARQRIQAQLAELQEQHRLGEQQHGELNGRQAEWDRAVEETASLREEVTALRQELSAGREELETTARRLEESQAENERLATEAHDHAHRLDGATAEAASVGGLRQELADLQAALADREREQSATLAKLADLEAQQQSSTQQDGQIKVLRQEIEQLNRLLAEREQAQSDATMHLTELRRSHQAALAQITQELEEARQQLADRAAAETKRPELHEEIAERRPAPIAPEEPPAFAAAPERPRPAPPAAPPRPPSRPSLRIPSPAELPPTGVAASPPAPRPASTGGEVPVGFDLEAVEVGLAALRQSLEVDRRAVEDELLRPEEIRTGLRPPAPATADLTSSAPMHVQKAREILKAESERLKRESVSGRERATIPDKGLASRRAAVESSPLFELPPPKPAPEPPPEPPPVKAPPRQQRGTLHGLRKWLGEK